MILMTQVIHEDGKGTIMSVSNDTEILAMFDTNTNHIDLSVLDNYRDQEGILKRIYEEDNYREEMNFIIRRYDHETQSLYLDFIEDEE